VFLTEVYCLWDFIINRTIKLELPLNFWGKFKAFSSAGEFELKNREAARAADA